MSTINRLYLGKLGYPQQKQERFSGFKTLTGK